MNNISKIKIDLPYLQENVFIGSDMTDSILSEIKENKYEKIVLIVDKIFYSKWSKFINALSNNFDINNVIFLKPTFNYKSFRTYEKIIQELVKARIPRNSCLVSIGGGYVADIAGYVASNYMRGIDFIQIATTFMSMVDPVVGKVAINYKNNKNILGSFYSPKYVFCDQKFLTTLNKKEIVLGLSEVWKHALIKNDKNIINLVEDALSGDCSMNINRLIQFSIETKKMFVESDYDDRNGRHKALSLGHTFANYLEKQSHMRHGSAVVYGIIFEAILSKSLNKLTDINYNLILKTASLFEKELGQLKEIQNKMKTNKAIAGFKYDKISDKHGFNFVLPTNKGYYFYKGITEEVVVNTLKIFRGIVL